MTAPELTAEMHRRIIERFHVGMTQEAYLNAAVAVMFEVVAEAIAMTIHAETQKAR